MPHHPAPAANSMTRNKENRSKRAPSGRTESGAALISIDALPARVRNIATLRGLGYSFREIGRVLNVSPQAVSLMLSRYRRSLQSIEGSLELASLSARAVNVLGRHGIRTPEEGRRADILARLENERNCGKKTLEEIKHWVRATDEPTTGSLVAENSCSHRLLAASAATAAGHTEANRRPEWKSPGHSGRLVTLS